MTTIDNLLEKYWAGETSLDEEAQLREYFCGSTVAEEHRPFVEAFLYPEKIANATLPDDFEEQLLTKINTQPADPIVKSIRFDRRWLAVAAAVLFLLTAGILLLKKPVPPNDLVDIPHLIINGKVYHPATEEEAYQLTKQALLLVSSKMTKEPKATIKSLKKIENVHPESWGK